ncbi:hypothetical protein DFP72DRAFT_1047709, partial [Ephemerocybe angulata]
MQSRALAREHASLQRSLQSSFDSSKFFLPHPVINHAGPLHGGRPSLPPQPRPFFNEVVSRIISSLIPDLAIVGRFACWKMAHSTASGRALTEV